ncbi:hypothetical protein H2202_005287 [Exophiala xenobiotica]|nr:hypothetical protein H2202_005287 [Exophiala xenobiotica]KAK5320817.1 hypothetical protein LTR93_007029 [Exophiala xenobiotica]KAK5360175.1 hypothetical protein LTS13_010265 [Exophiala xenobiotica]KAK5398821.1 hypothetical protein LTR79_003819 [Exophiala xenobiotica]KAK5415685.1 hypothetical protein LTR06_003735 [Exophiala xenobiotica]
MSTSPALVRSARNGGSARRGRREKGPSPEAWEGMKSAIAGYFAEGMTLKEIIQIMQQEHGFVAKPSMYNDKFRLWKLRKNFKSDEHRAAAKEINRLLEQGLPVLGNMIIDGRLVDLKRVRRYCGKNGRSMDGLKTGNWNPTLALARAPLQASPSDGKVELMLRATKSYWSVVVIANESLATMLAERKAHKVASHPNEIARSLLGGLWNVRHGQPEKGWPHIQRVCDDIKGVFRMGEPNLLQEIIATFSAAVWKQHDDLFLVVIRHFAYLAQVVLGPRHPMSELLETMTSLVGEWTVYGHFHERALEVMMIVLQENQGQIKVHRWHRYRLEEQLVERLRRRLAPDAALNLVESKFDEWRRKLGPTSTHTLNMMLMLAQVHEDRGKESEAERILLKIIGFGQQRPKDSSRASAYPLAAENLAQMYFRQRDWDRAEKYFALAWVWTSRRYGEQHIHSIHVMRQFADMQLERRRVETVDPQEEEDLAPDTMLEAGSCVEDIGLQLEMEEVDDTRLDVADSSEGASRHMACDIRTPCQPDQEQLSLSDNSNMDEIPEPYDDMDVEDINWPSNLELE